MKLLFSISLLSILLFSMAKAQDMSNLVARDAVSGSDFSLKDANYTKGLVLIFHDIDCPFAKMYANRIKELSANYSSKGFTFFYIKPEIKGNETSEEVIKSFVNENKLNSGYLIDEEQVWTKFFGIKKIPEVILIVKGENGPEIAFRGAIDNNPQAESSVSSRFLEKAINQILKGEKPAPFQVRAVGCNVRTY